MSQNTIHLVGNLVDDPTLRYTTNGVAVVNLRIGVNERYFANNEWQERTTFVNLVAWKQVAENIAASLTKGDRVIAEGALRIRSFEDGNGDKQYRTEVNVTELGVSLRFAAVPEIERNERHTSETKDDEAMAEAF